MRAIGRWTGRGLLAAALALGALSGTGGCTYKGDALTGSYQLKVTITQQNGEELPGPDGLTCLDLRGINPECPDGHFFKLQVEALDVTGKRDESFNRFVRLSILPGTIVSVTSPPEGEGVGLAEGRNVLLVNGYAEGQTVHVTGAFGPTRILVEDIGYQPGDPVGERKPSCADGVDNDGNGLIDFPADPGCAFSNDDTESTPTFAAGVSPPLNFVLPKVADVQGCPSAEAVAQGLCGGTPFAQEGVSLETRPEFGSHIVVTRVSSQGMYVSDITPRLDANGNPELDENNDPIYEAKPYSSLFVFNFGLPEGVLVCDRVTQLSGTMDEFFGYTEMNFPSFEVEPFDTSAGATTPNTLCRVPEPFVIPPALASDDATLERYEGGLVRVENAHLPAHFGSGRPGESVNDTNPDKDPCGGPTRYDFSPQILLDADGNPYLGPGRSNCDFDRSGSINFAPGAAEGRCACFCYQDPECSEWSSYRGRGSVRVVLGSAITATIQANFSAVGGFDAADASRRANALATIDPDGPDGPVVTSEVRFKLPSLTGTMANFSGGNLNWTIEARCPDDLVLCPTDTEECAEDPAKCIDCADGTVGGLSSRLACIGQRTSVDNDNASN